MMLVVPVDFAGRSGRILSDEQPFCEVYQSLGPNTNLLILHIGRGIMLVAW